MNDTSMQKPREQIHVMKLCQKQKKLGDGYPWRQTIDQPLQPGHIYKLSRLFKLSMDVISFGLVILLLFL